MLHLQLIKPPGPCDFLKLRFLAFHECEEEIKMPVSHLSFLAALLQALKPVFVDGLQHPETWNFSCALHFTHEALAHQRVHSVQQVHPEVSLRVTDGLYCLQGAPAPENHEPPEES